MAPTVGEAGPVSSLSPSPASDQLHHHHHHCQYHHHGHLRHHHQYHHYVITVTITTTMVITITITRKATATPQCSVGARPCANTVTGTISFNLLKSLVGQGSEEQGHALEQTLSLPAWGWPQTPSHPAGAVSLHLLWRAWGE